MIKLVCAAAIKNKEGKILAVHLNKEKPEGVWVTPGGKLEYDESCRDCVKREVKEELGVDIEVGEIIGISESEYDPGDIWTFLIFSAEIIKGEPKPMEQGKTLECKYIKREDLHDAKKIRWMNNSPD